MERNVTIICACTKNGRVIGNKEKLPWNLPQDLEHFKKITMGHPVIMGRKTFLSIGKVLPGRLNIVISHDSHLVEQSMENLVYADSFEWAVEIGRTAGGGECFVIGGETVFSQAMQIAKRIYLTEVEIECFGDRHFPQIDARQWKLTQEEKHPESMPAFSFLTYERI